MPRDAYPMAMNRMQVWLARGGIVAALCLIVVLKVFGPGQVSAVHDGNATTYSRTPILSFVFGFLGLLTIVFGIVYWMQRRRFYSLVSVGLFLAAAYILFNAPTGINHCVIVTPDCIYHRVGPWYAPEETRIDFESLAYVEVVGSGTRKDGTKSYDLQCFRKQPESPVRLPIYDLMTKALPEILQRVADHDIIIGTNADGWQLPPELRQ